MALTVKSRLRRVVLNGREVEGWLPRLGILSGDGC